MKPEHITLFQFVRIILKEKEKYKRDCFVIIYGRTRTGKTTIGLKMLQYQWLLQKNKNLKTIKGLGKQRLPPMNWWKNTFKRNFAISSFDATEKIRNMPYDESIFIDEGIDIASWHEQMTREQSSFIHLLQKTGEKRLLTIFITPSYSLLTKAILQRAHYLLIIPEEHDEFGNYVYLYKNYKDPIRAEKNPFDLNYLFAKIEKLKMLPDERVYGSSNRLIGGFRFNWINEKVYECYREEIKLPQLTEIRRSLSVPITRYIKVKYQLETLLSNLRKLDEKNYRMLERLTVTKFGEHLFTDQAIKKLIDGYDMLEKPPIELKKVGL